MFTLLWMFLQNIKNAACLMWNHWKFEGISQDIRNKCKPPQGCFLGHSIKVIICYKGLCTNGNNHLSCHLKKGHNYPMLCVDFKPNNKNKKSTLGRCMKLMSHQWKQLPCWAVWKILLARKKQLNSQLTVCQMHSWTKTSFFQT